MLRIRLSDGNRTGGLRRGLGSIRFGRWFYLLRRADQPSCMPVNEEIILRKLIQDRDRFLAYIRSIVRDDHLADDVLQDVSLLALKSRDRIDSEKHLMHWIRQASRHKAITLIQQRNRGPVVNEELLDLLDAEWAVYDELHSSDVVDALRRCLTKLSPYAARLIELRYTEGLVGKKLAAAVNRKVKTVYVALSRVHRSVANCIREELARTDERANV